MDGEIIQQRSSYRQGLVLGLTMAEIMLLLVFCLLIAMATFLKTEQTRLAEVKQELQQEKAQNERDRASAASLHENAALVEKLQNLSGLADPKEIDRYWRELVDSRTAMAELEKAGVSTNELRERVADTEKLRSKGIDVDKALRDADIVSAINRAMATKPGQPPPSTLAILDAIVKGTSTTDKGASTGPGPTGHQWPPIITLSEANGNFFKSGSAELSPSFHSKLASSIPEDILNNIKKFDVDVIEVVGHTDEQPLGVRQSNLDGNLLPVLKNTTAVSTLIPADNAGLGLARAVSVVSVLRQSPLLTGYKMIPLSAAQLVNTDETLAVLGIPANVPERRRIEIRLRKSAPDATASIAPPMPPLILPKPRPSPKQQQPLLLTPAPKPPPRTFIMQPAN
jgi:flagellar motor protein MotB